MTGDLVYLPVPAAARRAGCLTAAALYSALVCGLVLVLSLAFFFNFSRIFADVSQRALAAVLPHHMASLQPALTPAERSQFSNAFCSLATHFARAPSDPHGPQTLMVLNQLFTAVRDHAITRAECAAFVSNVNTLANAAPAPLSASP